MLFKTASALALLSFASSLAEAVSYTTYKSLPKFLTSNPLPNGYPWGKYTATNVNPESTVPDTGVTRKYTFSISRQTYSPDGYSKSGILVNGQFPGPLIEANWGDTIQVTVTNDKTDEGTTVHWHGLAQNLNPAYDGVPAVSQCPIAPGKSLTYTFRAEQYGTSWWHSHFSAEYMDGVYGPMVIYGPRAEKYDQDLGPVILTDYFHASYYDFVKATFEVPPNFLRSQNNLINGRMDANCIPGAASSNSCDLNKLTRFNFTPGKTYLLRLINAGVGATQKFSIDGYDLTVIANDFVAIEPYKTKTVTLGVGQRSDILVTAKGKDTDLVWMRSTLDDICYVDVVNQTKALGIISYPKAPKNKAPSTTLTPWESNNCRNDPLASTVPQYPIKALDQPATTHEIDITGQVNATGHLLWHMNNSTFRGNYNYPVLLLSKLGNNSYPDSPQWNVHNFGSNSSIRILLNNYWPLPHPIHLHGHNMRVLAEGIGQWDGKVVNSANPQRRDVHLLQPGSQEVPSYIVLEFNADNPGVWPLHCHIVADVSLGLYVNVVERPDLIKKRDIPASAAQTCRDWWTFTNHTFVNQIDSGL